jgi:Tol biopolymer transport system component
MLTRRRVELASGKHQVLCWPDSSATSEQIGHVHPSVSRTGKFVAYTSDRTGVAQVYLVPV